MESENMAYRFRVTDIEWDVMDEMEEFGETYEEAVKRHKLPAETEVEFIHNSNPTNAELVDAIGDALSQGYNFCVKGFGGFKLLEKGEVPQYAIEKENESKTGWLLIIRQDCGNTFVHLFRSKENAIEYVKREVAGKAVYYSYSEEEGNAKEQAEAAKVLMECGQWNDWGDDIYTLTEATYEDDGNNGEN